MSERSPETRTRITKIEAAQRQLDCAIRLFFEDDDSLAIHALAYAAFRVLGDLYPKRRSDGFTSHLDDQVTRIGWRWFNRVPNFLKHADNDPDAFLLEHSPEHVQPTIGLACILHHRMTGGMTPEMRAFDAWMHVLYPDHFQVPPDPDGDIEAAFRDSIALIKARPWSERLAMGRVLITFYREHPDVGGFGAPYDPESGVA